MKKKIKKRKGRLSFSHLNYDLPALDYDREPSDITITNASEAITYGIIWMMSQDGCSKFEGGQELLAKASFCSEPALNRHLDDLEKKGLITRERDVFNNTIYRAVVVSQNDRSAVSQNDRRIVSQNDRQNININNNIIDVVEEEPDGLSILERWICESQLDEWFKKQAVSFWSLGPDTTRMVDGHNAMDLSWYLSHFYEKIEVKERVEKSERMETLKHFQNWLPKYLLLERENENDKAKINRGSGSGKSSGSSVTERMLDRHAANEEFITIGGSIDMGF